jgi:hypothetical protein
MHWLAPGETQMTASPKVDAPRLELVNEARPGAMVTGNCVTVGPFTTSEGAAAARRTLGDSGYPSTPREVATREFDGYWVYLESPPTEAGERRLLDRLKKGGIADAQAVGDLGSRRISLGIFSDEGRAAAQSEKVAKLQLLPQIEAREKNATAIWLDLTLKSDSPPLEGQKFPAGDTELEFRPCEATPAGPPTAE